MTKEEFKECLIMALVRRGSWEQFFEELWQLHVQAQWISIEDRKPKLTHSDGIYKRSDTVIVTNGKYCTAANWVHSTWAGWYSWYDGDEEELEDVTHWMPMPEPPKKGGEK